MNEFLNEALAAALAEVVSDVRDQLKKEFEEQWGKDLAAMASESKAVISELRSEVAEWKAKALADQQALADLISSSIMIDRRGHLMMGSRDLGMVVGKDGDPGKDALGFEDMEETYEEDGRLLVRTYKNGDQERKFYHRIQVPIYRGVWQSGKTYEPGDVVTLSGSIWIAVKRSSERPTTSDDFVLAVKRGKDGKDLRDVANGS